MKKFRTAFVIVSLLFAGTMVSSPAQAKGFLHTQGQDMVDETGQKVLLQGVGLGNWLLPEGYMWKFGERGDRPRKIEKIVSDLIGLEKADKFWLEFRKNYIAEADIQRIAELGYNSVRPALNARRFLTEDDNPVFVEEGFQLLDNLVQWCKKYSVYVIIDMHGAPGGQTGQNIDDSPADEPGLFMDEKYQERLIRLWVKIVERYKDEPTVAAYDLLNEPLPKRTGADKYNNLLEPLYKKITEAIRKIDSKHMITLEGADWANDWSVFGQPFDKNVFYQFHFYCWDRPDHLNSVEKFIVQREKLNTPMWVGETGEKGNPIYWGTMQYFETNNIGWSFWPWKKMDTANTPYSINKPEGWDAIAQYSRDGTKPDAALAQKAFDQLLENIKLQNCVYFPDVVNAMFRRIPGRVEAENYGHQGEGKSYFVKDASQKAKNYRTEEPVPIDAFQGQGRRGSSGQYVTLNEGEWTAYDVRSLAPQTLTAKIRVKADSVPAAFTVSLNGKEQKIEIAETGWKEISLDKAEFLKDWNSVKIQVTGKTVNVDWIVFE